MLLKAAASIGRYGSRLDAAPTELIACFSPGNYKDLPLRSMPDPTMCKLQDRISEVTRFTGRPSLNRGLERTLRGSRVESRGDRRSRCNPPASGGVKSLAKCLQYSEEMSFHELRFEP
jgi:hypothetical protein